MSEFTLQKLLDAVKESPPPEWKRPAFIVPNEAFAEAARKEFGESIEIVLQERIYCGRLTYFTPQETSSLCAHCGKALGLHSDTLRCP